MKLKNFLFLQRRSPAAAGPEAFDLALTAAAFDQEVTLLLLDEGVHWLSQGLPELVRDSIETILVESQCDVPALIAAADVVVQG
jgi:sulfur relay (sulfurtransferase) DsrF/TusC family protein